MYRLLWLVLFAPLALAEDGPFHFDRDFDQERPWQEIETQMPTAPRTDKLVEFTLDMRTDYRYFVDPASLSVGDDGVVRYTVIVKSPTDAKTISFEGLRCEDGERKFYAFGHADGTWSRNRTARWEPIQARNPNSYQRALFYHYFCAQGVKRTVPELQRVLRTGGVYPHD